MPKRIATLFLCTCFAACGHGQGKRADDPSRVGCEEAPARGPADDVLDHYRVTLEEELLQKRNEPGQGDPLILAAGVAKRELLPHLELLHRQAIHLLRRVQRRPLPVTTGYRSLITEEGKEWLRMLLDPSLLRSVLVHEGGGEDTVVTMLGMGGWNPIAMANWLMTVVESRSLGVAEMGKRGIIRNLAPAPWYRTSDDWESPILFLDGAREIFIVRLSYDAGLKYYLPQQIEWSEKR
jgi:hypothetical protein